MKLEDQVVSLDLAKRLKELGVKQESAFHWVRPTFLDVPTGHILKTDQQLMDIITSPKTIARDETWEHHSAFTVAELGEMLKPCGYLPRWSGNWGLTGFGFSDTEADARAKMLIYLIENGLMKEKGS